MTGFTRCLKCGGPVVGACLNKSYRYYRCRATVPTSIGPATCKARYIPADDLEGYVWKKVFKGFAEPRGAGCGAPASLQDGGWGHRSGD